MDFFHYCYKICLIKNHQDNIEPNMLCKEHNSIHNQEKRQMECCKTQFCQKTIQSFLLIQTRKPEVCYFSIHHVLCIKTLLKSAVNYQL